MKRDWIYFFTIFVFAISLLVTVPGCSVWNTALYIIGTHYLTGNQNGNQKGTEANRSLGRGKEAVDSPASQPASGEALVKPDAIVKPMPLVKF